MTTESRFVPAKTSSSTLISGRQRISTSMTAYATSLEDEIEKLHCFMTWALTKIGCQEIEKIALRQQVEELHETVSVLSDKKEKSTMLEDVTPTRTIASPVTPVSVAGASNCDKEDSSGRAQTKRTVRLDDDATEKSGRKNKSVGLGGYCPSEIARPCTFPAKPCNFDL